VDYILMQPKVPDSKAPALNPASAGPDGSRPMLTFGRIQKMVANSVASWENADM